MTDVKWRVLPGTKFVKINSNLVPSDMASIYRASVVPLSFYTQQKRMKVKSEGKASDLTELTVFVLIDVIQLKPIAATKTLLNEK